MDSYPFGETDLLFAQPSFGSGFGRAIDLFGTFDEYNTSDSNAEADRCAIESDWFAVGNDLRAAMDQVRAG